MNKSELIKKYDLVDLSNDDRFIIDVIYNTANNFTGEVLYNSSVCLLRRKTYNKLVKSYELFSKYGYKIVVWDAFRPLNIQRKMWKLFPDERYVSDPDKNKSMHCKGSAVDITLCYNNGKLLEMPTLFDHFGEECHLSYFPKLKKEVYDNVMLLQNIMNECGFNSFETEWWHFTDSDDYEYIEDDFN